MKKRIFDLVSVGLGLFAVGFVSFLVFPSFRYGSTRWVEVRTVRSVGPFTNGKQGRTLTLRSAPPATPSLSEPLEWES